MRNRHILGLALFAALALSAVAASSAFALESTWLIGGVKPTAATAVLSESVGKIKLEDMSKATVVECEATDEGTVGPGPADKVTAIAFANCAFAAGGAGPCT